MERNQNITLAHINPDSFPPLNPDNERQVSMWFIGLTFKKGESYVDLTLDIKTFVDTSKKRLNFIVLLFYYI